MSLHPYPPLLLHPLLYRILSLLLHPRQLLHPLLYPPLLLLYPDLFPHLDMFRQSESDKDNSQSFASGYHQFKLYPPPFLLQRKKNQKRVLT